MAELPLAFRRACHWELYVQALVGPDGLPSTAIPTGAPAHVRMEAAQRSIAVAQVRSFLFPEDE